jgi:hypothetical protein
MKLIKLTDVEYNKTFALNPEHIVEIWPMSDGDVVRLTINAGTSGKIQRMVAGPLDDVLALLGES